MESDKSISKWHSKYETFTCRLYFYSHRRNLDHLDLCELGLEMFKLITRNYFYCSFVSKSLINKRRKLYGILITFSRTSCHKKRKKTSTFYLIS